MANVPTTVWSELTPSGSDNVSAGDNRIREMKTQIREVIDVDHDFPSSGQAADVGQHKKVTLQEQANLGTGAEGVPILGAQTVGGKAELVFTDEDDNDIQLTSGGKLDLGSGRLDNDEALTARNNADDGDLNLIKANASDQAVITPALLASGGAILPEITAPKTAANQGALYTKNDGTQTELYFREESNGDEVQITDGGAVKVPPGFGSWVDKGTTAISATQASTDGFLLGMIHADNDNEWGDIVGYTDSNAAPTTVRGFASAWYVNSTFSGTSGNRKNSFNIPVKKGEYYKTTQTVNGSPAIQYYWIPLGA